jgi:hypothetical protein
LSRSIHSLQTKERMQERQSPQVMCQPGEL